AGGARFARDAPLGAPARGAVLHDRRRRTGRGERDPRAPARVDRRSLAPGDPRQDLSIGGAVASSPFARALEACLAPLRFAADDGAAADRVRDLESSVREAASAAAALAVPREARATLTRVAERFAEPLAGEARAKAVRDALRALAPLADPAWAEQALARPVSALPGIGAKRAEQLARRGLASVGDLLFHLPSRYDDRRRLVPVGQLEVGRRATFLAQVLVSHFAPQRGPGGRHRRVLQAVVGDETGTVDLKWFHGGDAIQSLLAKGTRLLVTGDVRRYRFTKELLHPELEKVADGDGADQALREALRRIEIGRASCR